MPNVLLIEIDQQPIELYKLLKIADLVSGGGEAKVAISEGYVLLNNEVEFQKRKKVYDGDYIQFGDYIIEVQFVEQLEVTTDADNQSHNPIKTPLEPQEIKEKSPSNVNDQYQGSSKNQQNLGKSKHGQRTKKQPKNKQENKKQETKKPTGKRRAINF
ncbi:RNA-binding S4 domain-containing protein [Colwellia sp. MEBiC06753]